MIHQNGSLNLGGLSRPVEWENRWPGGQTGQRFPVLRYDRSRIHLRLLMKLSECRSDVESRKVNVKIANYRSYRCQIRVSGGKISK